MHIGTLFSLPLSSHRYFVLIDHTEVLLQTYDLDLRFRGHPGRPASPDLAPQGARDRRWGTDLTCACTRIGTCEGSLLSSLVTWLPNGPTWDCFRCPCFLALSVTSLFLVSLSVRFFPWCTVLACRSRFLFLVNDAPHTSLNVIWLSIRLQHVWTGQTLQHD